MQLKDVLEKESHPHRNIHFNEPAGKKAHWKTHCFWLNTKIIILTFKTMTWARLNSRKMSGCTNAPLCFPSNFWAISFLRLCPYKFAKAIYFTIHQILDVIAFLSSLPLTSFSCILESPGWGTGCNRRRVFWLPGKNCNLYTAREASQ